MADIHFAHELIAKELYGLAGCTEMPVVLTAEQMGFLNSFRLTFYNRGGVVPDVEGSRCGFEDVAGLMSWQGASKLLWSTQYHGMCNENATHQSAMSLNCCN